MRKNYQIGHAISTDSILSCSPHQAEHYIYIYTFFTPQKISIYKLNIQILRFSHMTYQHITDFLSVSCTSSGTSGFGPSGSSGMTWQALKSSKDEDIESCREGSKHGCTYPKILDIFIGFFPLMNLISRLCISKYQRKYMYIYIYEHELSLKKNRVSS